jgi:segregation and condensation protein A
MCPADSGRPEPAATVFHGPEPPENGASGPSASNGTPAATADDAPPVEHRGPRVSLERFEGPLDLLLHLIREEELDIGDIPIARITDQYLEMIEDLSEVDLDLAGEYLVMATTLMRIKARALLPRDEEEEDEDEVAEHRALFRRLLEYREFKRVAEELGERQDEWREIFRRAAAPIPEDEAEEVDDLGVGMVELLRAFRDVLARAEAENPFEVETESYSVEEQIDIIRAACVRSPRGVPFERLFEGHRSRPLLITTFLALLEMIRLREIVANQPERFGEIWLRRATEVETIHD